MDIFKKRIPKVAYARVLIFLEHPFATVFNRHIKVVEGGIGFKQTDTRILYIYRREASHDKTWNNPPDTMMAVRDEDGNYISASRYSYYMSRLKMILYDEITDHSLEEFVVAYRAFIRERHELETHALQENYGVYNILR